MVEKVGLIGTRAQYGTGAIPAVRDPELHRYMASAFSTTLERLQGEVIGGERSSDRAGAAGRL